MRLVDIDALGLEYSNLGVFDKTAFAEGWNSAIKVINDAPTVDAVPVVRCKDCKWLYDEPDDRLCLCVGGLARITPDTWCCHGERRDLPDTRDRSEVRGVRGMDPRSINRCPCEDCNIREFLPDVEDVSRCGELCVYVCPPYDRWRRRKE